MKNKLCIMIASSVLLLSSIAKAEIYTVNSDGIDFYMHGYPDQITYLTSTTDSKHPLICTMKDMEKGIINCSFDLENPYYSSSYLDGTLGFRTYDKSRYCNYSLTVDRSSKKLWVTNLVTHDMDCERYTDGSKYNVNY